MPEHAEPELLQRLNTFTSPEESVPEENPEVSPVTSTKPEYGSLEAKKKKIEQQDADAKPELSDEEFEELLDAIQKPNATASEKDEISEDEFENLLDELHGKGKFSSGTPNAVAADKPPSNQEDRAENDEISEEEFEDLLDQIHGKGKFDGARTTQAPTNDIVNKGKSGKEKSADENITEDEFDNLLDQIHGKGKFNPAAVAGGNSVADKISKKAVKPIRQNRPVNHQRSSLHQRSWHNMMISTLLWQIRSSRRQRPQCGWTPKDSMTS